MKRVWSSLLIAIVIAAAPASAQDPDKRVNFNVGGGYTFSGGEVRDYLGDGYNVNLGLTIKATKNIGLQLEYSYNGLGEKQISIPVSPTPGAPSVPTDFFADMNMQFGNFNLVFKKSEGKAKPYMVAGVGVYYRPVKVTTPSVGYIPPYCSPWWYYCSPGGYVPVDKIVGSRSSTDFGVDLGAGVDVALGDSASFYFEARYHYIWGPSFTNPTTKEEQKAIGQFFPITVGFRF